MCRHLYGLLKTMKFTFKKHKRETGLRVVGYPYPSSDIKLDGKVVGTLTPPTWQTRDGLWRIRLMRKATPTPERPSEWEWVTLKFKSQDEEECRKYILDNSEALVKLNLHSHEN